MLPGLLANRILRHRLLSVELKHSNLQRVMNESPFSRLDR